MRLAFDRGTLLIRGDAEGAAGLPGMRWDARVDAWRAPACVYPELCRELRIRRVPFCDETLPPLPPPPAVAPPELRPYQAAALAAWEASGLRGIVSLPTGAGKTRVAVAAMARTGLRTLCLVPTRALMAQWVETLRATPGFPVGEFGDGRRTEGPVTVATFASARRHMETLGNRHSLLVIDEVHHLGSGLGEEILEMSTAGARLGLSATMPEDPRSVGRLEALVGPEIYRARVEELAGRWLAPYSLVTISVGLSPREREAYDFELAVFRPFCREFFDRSPGAGWEEFIRVALRSDEGKRALAAWRRSRKIIHYTEEKRRIVDALLREHGDSRVLAFTADNDTAYAIAREYLVQPVTCDIGRRERRLALERFAAGELRVLVSARVLNEGIDVPAADVAIVIGGSLGAREYIQRVGRVLRPAEGKKAVVYDLVTAGTFEVRKADSRRRALAPG